MRTFQIFVLGLPGSGTTTFVQAARELQDGPREHNYSHPYNFGRILIPDESVLYLFAWSKIFSIQSLIETLCPSTVKDLLDQKQLLEQFSRADFSDTGIILIIDSADPELDQDNKDLLQTIQQLMHSKKLPYVVTLSHPILRTAQQMRDTLMIPDDIKMLNCELKAPSSTKKVVLELLALMPQDDVMRRLIEGVTLKIREV